MPLTHLCVPHSSVVPFPALSLCNGTVIRHTERLNAVFWTFLKKTTSLDENRISAKSTNASEFIRSTHTSLIDTPRRYMRSLLKTIAHHPHEFDDSREVHKVRETKTVDAFKRFGSDRKNAICHVNNSNEVTQHMPCHWSVYFGLVNRCGCGVVSYLRIFSMFTQRPNVGRRTYSSACESQ